MKLLRISHRSPKPVEQQGFTIVELMIATLVFSVILVVLTFGVLSFTRGFYKGLNSSATQTTARNLMNALAAGAEYAHAGDINQPSTNGSVGCLKIGNVEYHYYLGKVVDGTGVANGNYGVYKTTNANDICDTSNLSAYTATTGSTSWIADQSGTELLGLHMRVTELGIGQVDVSNLSQINVGIAYGDDDLLCASDLDASDPTAVGGCNRAAPTLDNTAGSTWFLDNGDSVQCKTIVGDQFCSSIHLSTSVQPRLVGINQ